MSDTPNNDNDDDPDRELVYQKEKRLKDLQKRERPQIKGGWILECCRSAKERKLEEKAGDRMSKELDVVTFLKK